MEDAEEEKEEKGITGTWGSTSTLLSELGDAIASSSL